MKDADANKADQATPVQITQDGRQVIIRLNQDRARDNTRVNTDLEITVPKGSTIQASGRGGDFDISNLDGDVSVSSDNAGIRLQTSMATSLWILAAVIWFAAPT